MTLHRFKTIAARISAAALLILLIWGCGRVPGLVDTAPPSSRLPFVKVLLEDKAKKHLISPINKSQLAINCYKDGKRVSYFSRKPVIVQGEGRKLGLYNGSGSPLDYNIDRIVISSRGKNPRIAYDNKKYRGLLELTSISGQLKLINTVYVEDYLKGVVPLEIGPVKDDQREAVKAQAIAARTYAMAHLGQYGPEDGYDLKSDIYDQVYEGIGAEKDSINSAIEATAGIVATYDGKMINAYYHSTCGGNTDDIEDVWNKDSEPYLVMVDDGDACNISKYFKWQEHFTTDQIIYRLEKFISKERNDRINIGRLNDIRIISRTPGGRIASIIFETSNGHYIFNKEEVRWVIGRNDNSNGILRSARFELDLRRDSKGNITDVIFNGRGYGHGIGMCQMGARGMASNGITYDSILSLYYQGIELKKLY